MYIIAFPNINLETLHAESPLGNVVIFDAHPTYNNNNNNNTPWYTNTHTYTL